MLNRLIPAKSLWTFAVVATTVGVCVWWLAGDAVLAEPAAPALMQGTDRESGAGKPIDQPAATLPVGITVPQTAHLFAAHCLDCHTGASAEAGLDLTALRTDLSAAGSERRWVQIYDRVARGEMPPADADPIPTELRQTFLNQTQSWLETTLTQRHAREGRVRGRRLTRPEVERSLQQVLGIDIPLQEVLPQDGESPLFARLAAAQSISHFYLEQHLTAVDVALDEAFRRALTPTKPFRREYTAWDLCRQNPQSRNREPEFLNERAVTWSSGLIFYGRLAATTVREDGWYRVRLSVQGLNLPKSGGVWTTVRTGLCVSTAPLLASVTAFEAQREPREIELLAWLPEDHMLEIRPGDETLDRAKFRGGQVGDGEGEPQKVPGIAINWLTMERVHIGPEDEQVRRILFGDLPVVASSNGKALRVETTDVRRHVTELMTGFASRAFRRPARPDELEKYIALVNNALDDGQSFVAALRLGYRALLCAPRFLYLTEQPGRLDDFALATRLSFLLTGGPPDDQLTKLAQAGVLTDERTLRGEVSRLLEGPGARRFVDGLAQEWLDLDQIDFTQPDRKLYRNFDSIVRDSMLAETQEFLATMLRENASVTQLVSANYTYLNSRLARHYGIDDIEGDELRRVSLQPADHRGGLITQGAILKVTANGSTTSPVGRGVWLGQRILGVDIPPPPSAVPAIEPDIRGAKTIRDQLEKHRDDPNCASCHVDIDPPGFALETFDPAGRWRDNYESTARGGTRHSLPIDPSGVLADGRRFQNLEEFQRLVCDRPEDLARNVAEKLIQYGTGADITFADRDEIAAITAQAATDNYGFRSILDAVITSPIFQHK